MAPSDTLSYDPYILRLQQAVRTVTGLDWDTLTSPSHARLLADVRASALLVLTKDRYYSLHELGRIFNRTHSTMLHTRRTAQDLYSTSEAFRAITECIEYNYQTNQN